MSEVPLHFSPASLSALAPISEESALVQVLVDCNALLLRAVLVGCKALLLPALLGAHSRD